MKKESKMITKKHSVIVVLAIILTIIIAGGTGYFIYQKFFAPQKTVYKNTPTKIDKETDTPQQPAEKQLDITDHTVQVLYSWFVDIYICTKEGFYWDFSNTPNDIITLENMGDSRKLDLIFRQLELEHIIESLSSEGQTQHFTTEQFESAAQKIFGIVPSYNKDLVTKTPSQPKRPEYSGYFYKFANYWYDVNTGNFNGEFAANGCGLKSGHDEIITFPESAYEKNNVLTLNVKAGYITNISPENAIISNLNGQDISNRSEIANHYDQLDTYVYTFEKNEQGQYYFKSVSLKPAQ